MNTFFGGVLSLAVFLSLALSSAFENAEVARYARPCCFINSQYSGVCAVTPVKGETCDSILKYLNNPISTGKTYCNTTRIRGGWKKIRCSGTS